MKKNRLFVTFLTIVTLIVSLTACGQKENSTVDSNIPVVENNNLDDITSNENTAETPEVTPTENTAETSEVTPTENTAETSEVTPTENIDETVPDDTTENQEVMEENTGDVVSDETTENQDVVEVPDSETTGSDNIAPEEPTVNTEETTEDQSSGKVGVIEATLENVAGFWMERPNVNLNEYDDMPDEEEPIIAILDNGFYRTITQMYLFEGWFSDWIENTEYGLYRNRLIKTDGSNTLTYVGYVFDDMSSIHNGTYYDDFMDYIGEIDSVEGNPDLPPVKSFEFVTVEALSDGTIRYSTETEEETTTKILYRAEY